jgi:hypothetical protein
MGKLLFGLQDPLAPDQVGVIKWEAYLSTLAGVFVAIVLLTILLIGVAYAFAARRRRIHTPADLFEPYLPMGMLSLSLVGMTAMGIAAYVLYQSMIGDGIPGAFQAAMYAGSEALLLSLVGGYLAMLIPGVTPAKYKYRPVGLLIGKRGARI